jgi:hypothetical protein
MMSKSRTLRMDDPDPDAAPGNPPISPPSDPPPPPPQNPAPHEPVIIIVDEA